MVVYKRLEEVCDILDSQRIPITASERTKGVYPYYGANGIQDYVDDYIFDDELVLLAEDGGNFGSTEKPIAYRVSGKCWVNNHAHVLKAKDIIDTDYLCLALMFYNTDGLVNGATRQKLTQKAMRSMIIPVRSSEDQQRIKLIIQKVFSLIESHKKQIDKLDELIKSRFVEMFGDPIINPYNWDELLIANVLRGKASNGFFAKRDEYCDNGNVSILGVTNIVNRMYSNCDNLPKTNANNTSIEKYRVQYGDILFCRSSLVAEGIGKASIVPENVPVNTLFECHVIRLPLDITKVVPEYIQVLSTMDYFRNQVLSSAKTATMTTIGQDGILKCNIILPPYEKQKEYLLFIKQVEHQKATVQKSIDRLEILKKSLMQEHFG